MAISRKVSAKGFIKQLTTTDLQGAISATASGIGGNGTQTITSNTVLTNSQTGRTILVNSPAASINITLPTLQKDVLFTIKDIAGSFATFPINIIRAGTESIEGVAANYVCNADYGVWTFQCDGSNWWIL
jgi:hypothetical protein